ncbi:MAG: hypothetical protein J3Q66DRAFT_354688 [Benniella sp.]|nr:MAG: hypothetical protein J3Q66DRAFT_354688 [Benniella sp.]
MKLSKATTLVLCAVLVALPLGTHAAIPIIGGGGDPPKTSPTTPPVTRPTTPPVVPSPGPANPTTAPPLPATSKPIASTVAPKPTSPVVPPSPSQSTNSTLPPSGNPTSCTNSSNCQESWICALQTKDAPTGICVQAQNVCLSKPLQTCTTHADCTTAFSFCTQDNGQMVCTGLGVPGTDSECRTDTTKKSDDGGFSNTVKIAAISVGSIAAMAVMFALVRWQRRRQRSKPHEMFGEMDYGVGGGATKGVESYAFSSRANAHGSDAAPLPPHAVDHGYEEPIGYSGRGRQDQYYGREQYDNNQHYGSYKEGGYGGGYDNSGYDNYQQGGHSEQDFGGYGHGGHGAYGGQGGYGGQSGHGAYNRY